MENDLNYEMVPFRYEHCFNHQCVKSKKCMRHLAAEACLPLRLTIRIINPTRIPEDSNNCPYFSPIKKIDIAWGLKTLLDNLPHKDVPEMKLQMINHFGRTTFYRIYRKERGMFPKDQEFIRSLFRQRNYAEDPVFESYTQDYQWD